MFPNQIANKFWKQNLKKVKKIETELFSHIQRQYKKKFSIKSEFKENLILFKKYLTIRDRAQFSANFFYSSNIPPIELISSSVFK